MNLAELISLSQSRVTDFFSYYLQNQLTLYTELEIAAKYSFLNGGKRIRPLIIYVVGDIFKCPLEKLDPPACAIELIHTYSLIHDDLPSMDNADLRRGNPSCHKKFNEAIAILTGDALQTLAFEILAKSQTLSSTQQIEMIKTLAEASGMNGMAGGQALDLRGCTNLEILLKMYEYKTGSLLRASMKLGLIAANMNEPFYIESLGNFIKNIGLAYQIQDDLLDLSDAKITGKSQHLDLKNKKETFATLYGVEKTLTKIQNLYSEAMECIKPLGPSANNLMDLANFLLQRKK